MSWQEPDSRRCIDCESLDHRRCAPGVMVVVCCICKREYDRKPCTPEMDGEVSHGVCPECAPAWRRSLGLEEEAQRG